MFGAVKMTLIICLTIIVVSVLLISYNEYEGRYFVVGNMDNSLYIFDKKNAVLNKCSEKGCLAIETKLPQRSSGAIDAVFQSSKMFDSDKTMTEDITMPKVNAVDGRAATQVPNETASAPEGTPPAQMNPAVVVPAPAPTVAPAAEPRQAKPLAAPDEEFVE
ncbi:MAG: hypothetical protein LBF56_03890 [Holosporales bacterium]|jgi:hypothetical protein|nr:hypothetical protein [Holosporales bacterium]